MIAIDAKTPGKSYRSLEVVKNKLEAESTVCDPKGASPQTSLSSQWGGFSVSHPEPCNLLRRDVLKDLYLCGTYEAGENSLVLKISFCLPPSAGAPSDLNADPTPAYLGPQPPSPSLPLQNKKSEEAKKKKKIVSEHNCRMYFEKSWGIPPSLHKIDLELFPFSILIHHRQILWSNMSVE